MLGLLVTIPYIAFEGPIAAGKTTHASLLSKYLSVEPILEEFLKNEFLTDFYADIDRWALPMQLWFLIARRGQMQELNQPLTRTLVADYSTLKNNIFARALLRDRELRLYEQIASERSFQFRHPDLIVYVDAENEVLLERIKLRNRKFEEGIDATYQDHLRAAYELEFRTQKSRVFRVDTSRFDLN